MRDSYVQIWNLKKDLALSMNENHSNSMNGLPCDQCINHDYHLGPWSTESPRTDSTKQCFLILSDKYP